MQNSNKEYFVIIAGENGTLTREYPQRIYRMTYQGIELFCYLAKLGQWNVVEKLTGLPAAVSQCSKIDAFAQARKIINAEGSQKVIKDIKIRQEALNQMTIYEKEE
jgi:hypothetical protein